MSYSGEIRDFRKPNQAYPPVKIISASQKPVEMEITQTPPVVTVHEEVVTEDPKLNKAPGDPTVRVREHDVKSWDKIRRLEDK